MEQVLAFFADPTSWEGAAGIPNRLLEHIILALLAIVTASAIALPLGFYIGHTGRLQLLGINIANIGRAIPSYAVMVMLLPVMLGLAPVLGYDPNLGLTFLPIFLAMVLLTIPPILVSTYAGLQGIDRDLIEVAILHPFVQPSGIHIDDEADATVHRYGQRLSTAHATAAGSERQRACQRAAELPIRDRGEGFKGTLQNALGTNVNPGSGCHLAVHR